MATYIKVACAFLNGDRQTYGELLKRTGLSRRTLSKVLGELVAGGLLEKAVLTRKKVYYVCLDPYHIELMMRWDWHMWGRPALEEYVKRREREVDGVEEAEEMLGFFLSLALSHPRAYAGVEGGKVVLYLDRDNKIILDTERFLSEREEEFGVAFTNEELFRGKFISPENASERIEKEAKLFQNPYTGELQYFFPPLLPKMNLGRCLEAWGRAFGLLIGSEKDFERWGIKVKQDDAGYYFENLGEVWEVKDLLRRTYNNYPRRETINKISALAYLLWLNREKLRPYITIEPIVV
jgi:DNA-binding HxlR family transcriptional regulator